MNNHPIVVDAQARIGRMHKLIGARQKLYGHGRAGRRDLITGLMEIAYLQQMQIERLERAVRYLCNAQGVKQFMDEDLQPPVAEGEDIDDDIQTFGGIPTLDAGMRMRPNTEDYHSMVEDLLIHPTFASYRVLAPNTPQQFINKWRGNLQGHDLESVGRVYWARSYRLDVFSDTQRELAYDFMCVTPDDENTSRTHALQALLTNVHRLVPVPPSEVEELVVDELRLMQIVGAHTGVRDMYSRGMQRIGVEAFLTRWFKGPLKLYTESTAANEVPMRTVMACFLSRYEDLSSGSQEEAQLAMDYVLLLWSTSAKGQEFVSSYTYAINTLARYAGLETE